MPPVWPRTRPPGKYRKLDFPTVATTVPYRQTFFRLLGFLRPYRVSLIVSIVLAVGSQAAAIVIAYLTGSGLENAITANSHSELYGIAVAVIIVGAFRALFMAGRRLISGRQALAVEYDMRNALYAKLLRLSFGFYDRTRRVSCSPARRSTCRPSASSSATGSSSSSRTC